MDLLITWAMDAGNSGLGTNRVIAHAGIMTTDLTKESDSVGSDCVAAGIGPQYKGCA